MSEFDLMLDGLCEEIFPYIDYILEEHPNTEARDIVLFINEDYNIGQFLASHVYGAYLINKPKGMK